MTPYTVPSMIRQVPDQMEKNLRKQPIDKRLSLALVVKEKPLIWIVVVHHQVQALLQLEAAVRGGLPIQALRVGIIAQVLAVSQPHEVVSVRKHRHQNNQKLAAV